ncbi:hypothetical protein AAFF_G00418180 [Aldrovandia affinis]|uniref:N-acetyltransferase domain-containing protein n=1 Tax=Aldrovandia affinis TaxID=143900 RepID=A0AAD7WJF8_9TELE|nr:hypothetical protein AAFF_G00418180 [Aldrovandia affinis]
MAEFHIRRYQDKDREAVKETFTLAMSEHVPSAFRHMLRRPLTQTTLICIFCTLLSTSGSLLLSALAVALVLAGAWQLVTYTFTCYIGVCSTGDLDRIREVYMERTDACFWVAESEGQVVGTVACLPSRMHASRECMELKRLAVRRSHRGLGIAKAFCQKVLEFAQENACRQVVLYTSTVQTDAQRLYEGIGYKRVREFVVPEVLAQLLNFTLVEYRYEMNEGGG